MSPAFQFRPGTCDEAVFRHLLEHDEYRMPERFGPADLVVDIGVHIGTFCYCALRRGAGHVVGFEAEPSNFECATRLLSEFGDRVRLANKAVWRSDDRSVARLPFFRSTDPLNTGGGSVVWSDGAGSVAAVPFDDVLGEVTEGGRRRVRMLKIDCEGSEFPILLTSKLLHLIDYIAGEYHEFNGEYDSQYIHEHARIPGFDRYTMVDLADHLRRHGFDVASVRHPGSHMGLFYATRAA
jgi:FkbM family methyltransferase